MADVKLHGNFVCIGVLAKCFYVRFSPFSIEYYCMRVLYKKFFFVFFAVSTNNIQLQYIIL